jgi:hypothetical protein
LFKSNFEEIFLQNLAFFQKFLKKDFLNSNPKMWKFCSIT